MESNVPDVELQMYGFIDILSSRFSNQNVSFIFSCVCSVNCLAPLLRQSRPLKVMSPVRKARTEEISKRQVLKQITKLITFASRV
jgi:hypothetical protein